MSHLTVIEQDNTLTVTEAPQTLTVASGGPQGPTGPQGPAGAPGGSAFVHTQSVGSASWIINHNLNRKVHVSIFNTGEELVFADVDHGTTNQTTITFPAPTTGSAVIS